MQNRISRRLVFLALTMLTACTTTEFVNRWHDPTYAGPGLKRILIIGMLKNDVMRRSFEDNFSQNITYGDVIGIPSYTLMPDVIDIDDKTEVSAVVKAANADSVLVTSLTAIDKEERRVPSSVDWVPNMGYAGYGGFYDYYGRSYRAAYAPLYQPAYTTTDTIVKLETRVFAVSNEKMIWAGDTESFNPRSSTKVIKELTNLVLKELKGSGLMN